jgi:uncharacterized DUF497 family protein
MEGPPDPASALRISMTRLVIAASADAKTSLLSKKRSKPANNEIRIISARKATSHEREQYEKRI